MTCSNCQRSTNTDRLRVGRCMSCYRYWRRHGIDRPREAMIRSPKQQPQFCTNCRERFAIKRRSLCSACYQYRKMRGRSRPRYLWAEHCNVCARPRRDDRRDSFTKGRCPICATYYNRYGKERTPEMVAKVAPLGWCDCGRPASQIASVTIGQRQDRSLPLCQSCADVEAEDITFHVPVSAYIAGSKAA